MDNLLKGKRILGIFHKPLVILLASVLSLGLGMPQAGPRTQEVPASEALYGSRREVACFVYHRFGDPRYPSTNISLKAFRAQLRFLRQEDYTVYTLGEAIARLRSTARLPEKSVVLTIDDSYDSVLTGAMPLLRRFGFKATLFVNTVNVGRKGYLSWAELKELAASGIELGNHSHSHAHFLNQDEPLAAFREDIVRAQQEFKAHLGLRPELFAYPYGEYTPAMERVVEEMGFQAAVTQHSGIIYPESDLYALPRYPMGGRYATPQGFKEKVKMRALRVARQEPSSTLLPRVANPPPLKLILDQGGLDLEQVQCFIQGAPDCTVEITGQRAIRIRANRPLRERRTVYTVTAPSPNGKAWHWFSHLWIQPEHKEIK